MSAKPSKSVIGAFVLGGLALLVLGIMALGGGRLLEDDWEYVLYFDGSVSGLTLGAPVVFRGVPLGRVTEISLVANMHDSNVSIPVKVRINERSILRPDGHILQDSDQREIIQRMVQRGLRARLQLQSMITGQYKVELDFHPKTPAIYRSATPEEEIPTMPSPIDALQRTLAKLPLERMVQTLGSVLDNLSQATADGQLKEAIASFTAAFREAESLLADSPLRKTMDNTLQEVHELSSTVHRDLPAALAAFRSAMESLDTAARKFGEAAQSAEKGMGNDSPALREFRRLLHEASAAARSLRNLAEMLERNPEALLRGK